MALGIDKHGKLTACPTYADTQAYNAYLLSGNLRSQPISTIGLPAGVGAIHDMIVSRQIEREQQREASEQLRISSRLGRLEL
jgi:hypothetical protein